jgi:hypothetical protein
MKKITITDGDGKLLIETEFEESSFEYRLEVVDNVITKVSSKAGPDCGWINISNIPWKK